MFNRIFSRKHFQTIIAGVLSVVLLAACGANTPSITPEPTNAKSTLDVCSYLTKAEVQPALDAAITKVEPNIKAFDITVTPNGSCAYEAGLESVILVIAKPNAANGSADWKVAQSTFFASASYNGTVTTVNDLGDAALWSEADNGKGGGGYAVAKYPYLVDVLIGGKLSSSPETYGVKLLTLTKLVLSRLQ